MARILDDGAAVRAVMGISSALVPAAGLGLGIYGALTSGYPLAAPFLVLLPLTMMGAVDALAPALGWAALVAGQISLHWHGWTDARTAGSLFVALTAVPLVATCFRPLRRVWSDDDDSAVERVIDYLLVPLFLAMSLSALWSAVNGLAGLTVMDPAQMNIMRWSVGGIILARFLLEDLATKNFANRLEDVSAGDMPRQFLPARLIGLAISVGGFLAVMVPFFGLNKWTLLAAGLNAIGQIMKMVGPHIPNSRVLFRYTPHGFAMFATTVVVGAYLSLKLLGDHPTATTIRGTFIFLMLPGVILTITSSLGRDGRHWNPWLVRVLGVATVVLVGGLMTGRLVLFH